jgi:hypothetical protein
MNHVSRSSRTIEPDHRLDKSRFMLTAHADSARHGAPGMDLLRWPQDWITVSVVPQRPGS